MIIFGTNVTKKVRNQMIFVFSHHLYTGSALLCETGNSEMVSFRLNTVCYFSNEHTKHTHIITWSQLNYPSFPRWSTVYIRQL